MKIKILQAIAGHSMPQYGLADFSFPSCAVIDIAQPLAEAWIKGEIALAADKHEKLTMPVEVYTLKAKPAQAELPAAKPEESAS